MSKGSGIGALTWNCCSLNMRADWNFASVPRRGLAAATTPPSATSWGSRPCTQGAPEAHTQRCTLHLWRRLSGACKRGAFIHFHFGWSFLNVHLCLCASSVAHVRLLRVVRAFAAKDPASMNSGTSLWRKLTPCERE